MLSSTMAQARRSVLFGVDFAPVIWRAIPWVREYMAPAQSAALIHAVEEPETPPFLRDVLTPRRAAERSLFEAHLHLESLRDRVGASDADVIARPGQPDEVLRDIAIDRSSDLIVIGAHGPPLRPWKRIGTTTERLLRAAPSSILVARGQMDSAPRRIVVAVDDVDVTPAVLSRAGEIADAHQSELHAVHVLSPSAYSHMVSAEAAETPDDTELRARIEADLSAETLRWLRALWASTQRHSHLHADVPHGRPPDEILRPAREHAADLTVIGRYGLGRAIPALLGSVVGSVVAGADCPVLVVAR